jgi:hypothetical protein
VLRFDVDDDLGYRIYALEKPLQPGDSLHLSFEVHVAPHGFRNQGADAFVVQNGTHFTNRDLLPAIGYQRNRELDGAGVRRQHGLARRPAVPSLDDAEARRIRVGGDPIAFEAIVGTSGDQVAVAPGALRRTWTEGGRRYFHYLTDVPTNNQYAVFSARYALHEEQWNPSTGSGPAVAIQIFHHPGHAGNLGRMVASVRASLDHYTRQFGPYPYSYIRLIENPVRGMGVATEAATVEYGEGFSLLNPGTGPQDLDVVFAVVAHGVARGWWGMQVVPADVEGAGLLTTSLETYSAMPVVEETLGPEYPRRYLLSMREGFGPPRTRAAPPLLRATDSFSRARKGPFALYAMREYIGKDRVDDALRSLLKKHGSGAPPLPTSLDLYRELLRAGGSSREATHHGVDQQLRLHERRSQREQQESRQRDLRRSAPGGTCDAVSQTHASATARLDVRERRSRGKRTPAQRTLILTSSVAVLNVSVTVARSTYSPGLLKVAVVIALPSFGSVNRGVKRASPGPRQTIHETGRRLALLPRHVSGPIA